MELFSYHVIQAPFYSVAARLISSASLRRVPGLRHAECLLPMRMGHSVARPGRYRWTSLAFFGFWEGEAALEQFLESPPYAVFERPAHPYTRALIEATPSIRRREVEPPLEGELPNPTDPPSGCTFRTRCPIAEPRCGELEPPLALVGDSRRAACIKPMTARQVALSGT